MLKFKMQDFDKFHNWVWRRGSFSTNLRFDLGIGRNATSDNTYPIAIFKKWLDGTIGEVNIGNCVGIVKKYEGKK